MPKATHKGNCQVCGALHMLPGGRLAKHGYTTRHGWFEGVCWGSDALPYQQSKDLIEGSISRALARAIELREMGAKAVEEAKQPGSTAWEHVYHRELSNHSRGPVRLWEQVNVHCDEHGRPAQYSPKYAPSRREETRFYGTLDAYRLRGAQNYARHMEGLAKQAEEYADHQRKRIADWQPADLIPR
jgi:hypothetical protein